MHDRIEAPCLCDGPINGQSFPAYVQDFLVPTLGTGDVVIMDNLGSHGGQGRSAGNPSGRRQAPLLAEILAQISTPSSRSSRNSSICSAKRRPAPTTPWSTRSPNSSYHSPPTNAAITSPTQDIESYKINPLWVVVTI